MMLLSLTLRLAGLDDCIQVFKRCSLYSTQVEKSQGSTIEKKGTSSSTSTENADVHIDAVLKSVIASMSEEIAYRFYDGVDASLPDNYNYGEGHRNGGHRVGRIDVFTSMDADMILCKLAGKLSVLTQPGKSNETNVNEDPISELSGLSQNCDSSALLEMLQKKLTTILTLKFDEQIAFGYQDLLSSA
jgi:hypothetical protein